MAEPLPVLEPEPGPPEPLNDEIAFGERLAAEMRVELEAFAEDHEPPPKPARHHRLCDDSDIVRAERGHPAFGLQSRDFWRGRITRGLPSYGGPPGR